MLVSLLLEIFLAAVIAEDGPRFKADEVRWSNNIDTCTFPSLFIATSRLGVSGGESPAYGWSSASYAKPTVTVDASSAKTAWDTREVLIYHMLTVEPLSPWCHY